MLNNYYTIHSVAEFFKKEISGYFISEAFSQEKNKFLIEIKKNSSAEEYKMLEFSIEKEKNYLTEKNFFSKAKKNYADIFPEIYGKKILETGIYNNDRVICFDLTEGFKIIFTFFTNKSNCFIVKNSVIVNSFKDKDDYQNKDINDVLSFKTTTFNKELKTGSVKDILKTKYRKLGNIYLKEVIFKSGYNENDQVNEDDLHILEKEIDETILKLSSPEFILYKTEHGFTMSLINLTHLESSLTMKFPDINQLIQEFLKLRFRSEKIDNYKNSKQNEFTQKLSHYDKKINGIKNQLAHCENSDELRKFGELIIQNSYLINKGDKTFIAPDVSGIEVIIKLKENLSPIENSQAYFDKYKKQRSSVETLKTKIKKLESEKSILIKEFEETKELNDVKKIMKEEKKSEVNKNDETSRFRKFNINEKYEVWVGKDSLSNDLLTTKHSAQNDLWFHVRGASGSHTVLKVENKKDEVSKENIYAAAAIAAYYSKARNSGSVPVAYCEKKYVKKKKGFKAGSVVMEREKVIFVKPALPVDK